MKQLTPIMAYDIETAPLLKLVKKNNFYDPDDFKPGNTKDPIKLAIKKQEHEAKFWATATEKAALNAHTAEVVAIGYKTAGMINIDIRTVEADMLDAFWNIFNQIKSGATDRKLLVGWNCFGFDLPFMIKRSWINNVEVPCDVMTDYGFDPLFKDAKKRFNVNKKGWDVAKCGLTESASMFRLNRLRKHEVKGKDFHKVLKTDRKRAEAYLTDDVEETYAIAMRIGVQ